MDQEAEEKRSSRKRKAGDIEKSLLASKKRLKELTDNAKSCEEEAQAKVRQCHKTGDLNLIAQSIDLTDQATKLRDVDIVREQENIKELESQLL